MNPVHSSGLFHIFSLENIGFLEIFISDPYTEIKELEKNQFLKIISRFTNALEVCLKYHKLEKEIECRNKLEEVLITRENKWEEIYHNLPLGYQSLDKNGYILNVNKRWPEILGYSRNEVIGHWFGNFLVPECRTAFINNFRKLKAERQVRNHNLKLRKKNGDVIDAEFNSNVTYDPDGSFLRTHCVLNNITERRQAEIEQQKYAKKLAESEERLKLVLEASEEGFWDYHIPSGSTYYSETGLKMLGYDSVDSEPHINFWKNIIHPADRRIILHSLNDHLENKIPHFKVEHRLQTKSGEWKWIYVSGKVIEFDKSGKPSRMAGTQIDINDRKNAENKLKEYANELKHSNELKELFADILRHDLLNPVNIAQGYCDILKRDEDDPKKLTYLNKISKSTKRLTEIIENASILSKIENQQELDTKDMDIKKLLIKAIDNYEEVAHKKEISIELISATKCIGKANTIIADVFSNFLSNAIKYSPRKSNIKIILEKASSGYLNIKFVDQGSGIDDLDKPYIFERLKRTHKGDVKGMGLGLAIAKKIVELHGGTVGVEDNPEGQGSVFWLTLQSSNNK